MSLIRVEQGAASCIGAGCAQQHGAGDIDHAGTDGVDDLAVRLGAIISRPEGEFVKQGGDNGITSRRPIRGGVDFEGDAVAEIETDVGHAIAVALNQLCQHRDAGDQAFAVPHDDTRLLAVGRDDHDGAALAGSEILLPVFEAGEEHGDERKGEGLPAAAADDHPCLVMSLAVAVFASRALSEQLALWLIKWISEQHSKEGAPRHPACSIVKMRRKQVFIVHRIEDGEVPSIASCRFAATQWCPRRTHWVSSASIRFACLWRYSGNEGVRSRERRSMPMRCAKRTKVDDSGA